MKFTYNDAIIQAETAKGNPSFDRQTDNEYLHRIHFWIRLWCVLSLVGGGLWLLTLMAAASKAAS
jgi:hypothetical protein